METEGEARGERGGESSKRRRKEDNSPSRIGDESATAEIEKEEEAKTSEGEEGNIHTDLEVFMDESLTEEEEMDAYRKHWEWIYDGCFGGFEDTTRLSSMFTTYVPNGYASVGTSLQVYSIEVAETKLMWPLQVYGLVAARDRVDCNRNLLFNRNRDNCQIITEKDPYLLLTGPSRAIVFLDPVDFEIELKVKGESEDKEALISQVFTYNGTTGPLGTGWSNNLCTINLHFKKLDRTVQATIISVRVIRGSWPSGFGGQVVSRDISSPEEVVLLDFLDEVPMDPDGCLHLSRRVVSVDVDHDMTISVKAYSICGDMKVTVGSGDIMLTPQERNISKGTCDVGDNCQVEIKVAWSLLLLTPWQQYGTSLV